MIDYYKIDSHKLIYHSDRVSAFLQGEDIYPIYIEISPNGLCNHRCTFCGLDFMKYKNKHLNFNVLKERLYEIRRLGIKSIMYSGEGEPLLHRQITNILISTKNAGIDAALTTNGVLLNDSIAEIIIANTKWVKISINAGTSETYSKVHQTKKDDFDLVIKNMLNAVKLKKQNNYKCTIGVQIIMLPENMNEIAILAGLTKAIGVDYFVVKPYSQHSMSKNDRYKNIYSIDDYKYIEILSEKLETLNDNNFKITFRMNAFNRCNEEEKPYNKCLALPFWSYIDSEGNVWGCSCYLGDNRLLYGNIYEETFKNIWKGEKRKSSLEWVDKNLNISTCRINCRMDEINRYLWKLKHPPEHVNFI